MWILKQLQDISLVSKHHLRLKHCLAEFAVSEKCPASSDLVLHFAVWKERKILAKVEIVLLTSWHVRWCVIYTTYVVHGGTWYISIEVFVDNPVITALEAPPQAGSPWWKILLISLYCADSLERGVHGGGQGVAQAGPVHHLVGRHWGHPHSWWSSQVCTWITVIIRIWGFKMRLRACSYLVLVSAPPAPPDPPALAGWAALRPPRPPGATGGPAGGRETRRRGRGRPGRRAATWGGWRLSTGPRHLCCSGREVGRGSSGGWRWRAVRQSQAVSRNSLHSN